MNKTYIYGLKEKEGEIRYVGKANDPKRRLRQHKSNARKEKSHKVSWIKFCQENNIEIELIILEECSLDNWVEKEIYWISQFKNLTNHDKGGRGGKPEKYSISYTETKEWVKLNLSFVTSISNWNKNKINLPDFISPYPNETYKYRGWISWGDFLGTGRIQDNILSKSNMTLNEAKEWVKLKNLKNRNEFRTIEKPYNIPSHPDRFYSKSGWSNWFEFLNGK